VISSDTLNSPLSLIFAQLKLGPKVEKTTYYFHDFEIGFRNLHLLLRSRLMAAAEPHSAEVDHYILSTDPDHPANMICTLCRNFYSLGWVGGTGGGTSIKQGPHIFIAPSGVQKELMRPTDIFVLDYATRSYLRKPPVLKPSACTPLFLAAFDRGAGCCIHTHSQWAVLVTLLVEQEARQNGQDAKGKCFEIEMIEQIKGIPRGRGKQGMLGFFDRLRLPIIENTAQ